MSLKFIGAGRHGAPSGPRETTYYSAVGRGAKVAADFGAVGRVVAGFALPTERGFLDEEKAGCQSMGQLEP